MWTLLSRVRHCTLHVFRPRWCVRVYAHLCSTWFTFLLRLWDDVLPSYSLGLPLESRRQTAREDACCPCHFSLVSTRIVWFVRLATLLLSISTAVFNTTSLSTYGVVVASPWPCRQSDGVRFSSDFQDSHPLWIIPTGQMVISVPYPTERLISHGLLLLPLFLALCVLVRGPFFPLHDLAERRS